MKQGIMEPVLDVDKGPSRVSRLRMMLIPALTHPKNAEITVAAEPPIAFVGPKVFICRRRTDGTTPPTGPLKAIQTVFRKLKTKQRKGAENTNHHQQQELTASNVPTPQTETQSYTTEPPSDRLAQEQDADNSLNSLHGTDGNSNGTKQITETAGQENEHSFDDIPHTVMPGMKNGFALPHDCPTIIEGEEWGSGDCSDPEEATPQPHRCTQATSSSHALAEDVGASATLESTPTHMQTPTIDGSVLQSGAAMKDKQHRCPGRKADWSWQAVLSAPFKASKKQLAYLNHPFMDCTCEALHREPDCAQHLQPAATQQPDEAVNAPSKESSLIGQSNDTSGEAEQNRAAGERLHNPSGTPPQLQGRRQREGESNSGGSSSVIAGFMEKVVSVLEGSAAILSSCGTADIIDESQLVVSNARMATRSRQGSPSSRNSKTTVYQSNGSAPSLQMQEKQQSNVDSEVKCSPSAQFVPVQPTPNEDEETRNHSCSPGEDNTGTDVKGEYKNSEKDEKIKGQEPPKKSAQSEVPAASEKTFPCVDKAESKSVSCLTDEQEANIDLSSHFPIHDAFSTEVQLPKVPSSIVKQPTMFPKAAVMRFSGSYITACTAEGARVHIQHFESNKAHIVNIARCTTTFAGLDKARHALNKTTWDQQASGEIQAHSVVLNACLDAATKNMQTSPCKSAARIHNEERIENKATNSPLRSLIMISEKKEHGQLHPPLPKVENFTEEN